MNYVRYGLNFAAVALGVAVAIKFLSTATDNVLGSSAQLMVPAMIAALIEGQKFVRKHERRPDSRETWAFVWIATLVAVVLNVALAFGGGGIAPEFAKLAIAPVFSQQFTVLLGIYAGGYVICNRFFVSIGAGNQLSLMRSREESE